MPGGHRLAETVVHTRCNSYYQIQNRKNRRPDPSFGSYAETEAERGSSNEGSFLPHRA